MLMLKQRQIPFLLLSFLWTVVCVLYKIKSVYALFPGLIVVTLKTHDVYSQVSEMFSPYFKYCAEQTACQQYCKDQDRDNQVFKAYLAVRSSLPAPLLSWPQKWLLQWCETQRDCNRLRLIDILVRPMQRLTKYSLLLKAVLKKTDDVSQKKDLAEMVRHRYFGREINLS